jgi:hypothetical protein
VGERPTLRPGEDSRNPGSDVPLYAYDGEVTGRTRIALNAQAEKYQTDIRRRDEINAALKRKAIFWKIAGPIISAILIGIGTYVWFAVRAYTQDELTKGLARATDLQKLAADADDLKAKNEAAHQILGARIDAQTERIADVQDRTAAMYQVIIEDRPATEAARAVRASRLKRGAK